MHKSDKYAIPKKVTDYKFKLPQTIFNKKIDIINKIYGFDLDSFELRSCSKEEKFNQLL